MPGLVQGSRSSYIYVSDDGKSYQTNLSTPKAVAGGFGVGPASGGIRGRTMKMRYVEGAVLGSGTPNSGPARTKLYISSPTNTLYTGGTSTFSVTYPGGTLTYQVTGIFGEKRERLAAA